MARTSQVLKRPTRHHNMKLQDTTIEQCHSDYSRIEFSTRIHFIHFSTSQLFFSKKNSDITGTTSTKLSRVVRCKSTRSWTLWTCSRVRRFSHGSTKPQVNIPYFLMNERIFRRCEQFCLNKSGSYKPCIRNSVKISQYPDFSDPILWSKVNRKIDIIRAKFSSEWGCSSLNGMDRNRIL